MANAKHYTFDQLLAHFHGETALNDIHLKQCDECRQQLEAIGQTHSQLQQMPELEPPADLWKKIENRYDALLEQEQKQRGEQGVQSNVVTLPTTGQDSEVVDDSSKGSVNVWQWVSFGLAASLMMVIGLAWKGSMPGSDADADSVRLANLVQQSQQLEAMLAEKNAATRVGTNAELLGHPLRAEVAQIDKAIQQAYFESAQPEELVELWQRRIVLIRQLIEQKPQATQVLRI